MRQKVFHSYLIRLALNLSVNQITIGVKMSKRDEYATKLKETVDEFNEIIAELEVKAGQAQAEVKAEIEKQIASLKEQAKPLTDKLDQWKEESEEKMDEYLKEAKKIRDAFLHSFNYFKSQLK